MKAKENVVTVVAVISIIVTTCIILLRVYARAVYIGKVGVDDWVAVAALILAYGTTAITINADLRGGLGQSLLATPVYEVSEMLKSTYIHLLVYPVAISMVRVSILLFYRRLAGIGNKFVRNGTTYLLYGSVLYVIINWALVLSMCKVKSDFWDVLHRAEKCGDKKIHFLNTASIGTSIVMDILVLTLPLRMIWQTQLPTWDRIVVTGLLMLGFSAAGVTIFRAVYWETENDPVDFSIAWNALPYSYWIPCQLEGTVALSAASVPMLRPLLGAAGRGDMTKSGSHGGSVIGHTTNNFGGTANHFRSRAKRNSMDETDTVELVAPWPEPQREARIGVDELKGDWPSNGSTRVSPSTTGGSRRI